MTARVILVVSGSDRPGLTRAVAEAVHAAGGNWLESYLSRLGGKYVGSVLVELDAAALPALEAEVRKVDATGLRVSIVPVEEAEPAENAPSLQIELLGQDRPGIVREVTSVLADLHANIESMTTSTESSAWSGEPLFRAKVQVALPENVTPDAVQTALEAISGELMVDFTITAAKAVRPTAGQTSRSS